MKKESFQKGHPGKDLRKHHLQPRTALYKNRYADLVGLSIIIFLGIIIYSNTFTCSFHFDDFLFIVDNTNIRNLADFKAWWNYAPNRPVGYFTFVLNYHFNQLDVRYWHIVNLVIHLINACLVWWLTMLIFSSPVMKDLSISRHKHVIAFLTAILFVSHPLATQSVTYIYQRVTSLAGMFYFLALVFYLKARYINKRNITKFLLYTGSFLSVAAAILTKENAFTLPLAMVLFEMFFLRTNSFTVNFRNYRILLLTGAFLGIILILPLRFSLSIFKTIPPSGGNTYTLTPVNYLFTQFSVIVKYIQLLFLPVNQKVDYDFPVSTTFFEIRTLLSFLVIASLILFGFFLFKRYRIISFGIFWFFLTLSIESSFIPINDVIFEHRTYLPSFGFFLILSTVIYGLLGNRYKVLASVIMVIIVIINSYLTYSRNKVWKDDISLWNDNVLKTPNKARPFVNRGIAYRKLGQLDNAIVDWSKAIAINPDYIDGYINRGLTYSNIGQWEKSILDFSRAIELNSRYSEGYSNRGSSYGNLGQLDKAIADFSKAIEIDPENKLAYFNRALSYGNIGLWDKSISDYSNAIRIDPNYRAAYSNRDTAYRRSGIMK